MLKRIAPVLGFVMYMTYLGVRIVDIVEWLLR